MPTKIFCYFCESCGSDTVSYEIYEVCPYCHSSRQDFRLIAQTMDMNNSDIIEQIEQARAKWLEKQPTHGLLHRKHRLRRHD